MPHKFPQDQARKRQALLDAVTNVKDTLLAGAEQSEEQGTLDRASVDALYQSGLLSLKTPEVLGGAEAAPPTSPPSMPPLPWGWAAGR